MRIDELQFDLPPEYIAQYPADRRDASRLMVVRRDTGQRSHEWFNRLPQLLPPGALLVLNDTRVLPARLHLKRRSGGRIEGLFLHEPEPGVWEMMLTESRRLRAGELLSIEPPQASPQEPAPAVQLKLIDRQEGGMWKAAPVPAGNAHAILMRFGQPPLPPYIKRPRREGSEAQAEHSRPTSETVEDAERYQTVYARHPGAVAAPTAGLHFTQEVFDALATAGISTAFVTLHVGAGTFAPIRCEDLADHPMHAEWYECPEASAAAVNAARAEGRPIVAVGTTSVRVLETCADEDGRLQPGSGWTRLFIYPPYRFKAVDAILTNFHLPGSTLLAMIFAFAGRETTLAAYEEAIRAEYRFYSYGDAMLIL
ncbi:MAG TPA: tRNA preQ1(34) S-adenosylmethionine ribosyltransferase-isomerase QueA [Phycisphaerae bacterium]|nr:tRNA preQ1(34) S-adenosylmethionine ribosyltransferase-isomerase QueA [Phycisphaerae bacterium]HOB75617.1 tRNA preQ1(34) S-adenosylmethionine ribosyltransferase-isomerase QueA [Phycisphaerae bacterium]HOJ56366.1 tRNA preQ1(34) S-adenosylmethionine ribosyltransferase-isomerase QueA [Phycisphaerae bacterium]HOL28163.1 tRNA preQ1(34) S-adenosylmethionine ribosyltransferase-isomerase QueA [Phycisphaerae bacterium]HPP22602.1 tRNA preQ1(34) S-adenosylmethionine ribosyltransferase-isomerase QueA [P